VEKKNIVWGVGVFSGGISRATSCGRNGLEHVVCMMSLLCAFAGSEHAKRREEFSERNEWFAGIC
ncbi:MAG: hypothetical protein WCA37_15945, partial [Terracidiphilus sp.]